MDRLKPRLLNGYVVIYKPEYENSMTNECWKGWIYEHIYIAETEVINRKLRKEECVHHLDENRSNNHPNNLLVMLKSQHGKLHNWLRTYGAPTIERCRENPLNSGKPKAEKIPKPIKETNCLCCGRYVLNKGNIKYCSDACARIGNRKVKNPPTKTELEKLVWELPTTKIAKIYNVSDTAVSKWCKIHNITKPSRGYWSKAKAILKQTS